MKSIKIFSILFLILCIASLGVTVALTFLRENEKAKRIEVEQQNKVLEAEKRGLESRANQLEEEKKKVNEQLAVQTKLVEDYRTKLTTEQQKSQELQRQFEKSRVELESVKKEFQDFKNSSSNLIEDYKKQNKELLAKLRLIEKDMKRERRGGFGPFRSSKTQDGKATGSIELEPVVVKSDRNFSGRVMVVNRKFNFIISNIGKNDGLELGDTLAVSRSGKQVGMVKVEKIYDALSASGILQEDSRNPIQEGDIVGN